MRGGKGKETWCSFWGSVRTSGKEAGFTSPTRWPYFLSSAVRKGAQSFVEHQVKV